MGRCRAEPGGRTRPGDLGSAPSLGVPVACWRGTRPPSGGWVPRCWWCRRTRSPQHCPRLLGVIKERFQRRPSRAFQGRTTVLTRLTGWRWRVQGGVQTQSGDECDGSRRDRQQWSKSSTAQPLSPTSTRGRWGSQRHNCTTICRAQSVTFLCRRPCCWWYRDESASTVSTGNAQSRPAQGTWPNRIREIQRNPLGLTSWLRLERTRVAVDGPRPDLETATPLHGFVDWSTIARRRSADHRPDPSRILAVPTGCVLLGGATTPPD